ncbi:MAG: type II toxin-antitoxin system VapC family toxin [Chloroflexi bacterium]|nr:type II toxin-antitoxin system VapC family toxin [Chloroflexota bacterium]
MSVVLLDTNIVSFLLKGDSRAQSYAAYLQHKEPALSFMTVAELYQWAFIRNWGERRLKELEKQLQGYLVFPFDIVVCRYWAEVRADCRRAGRPISSQDAWVAATALQYNLPLVTHNPADFSAVANLKIITTIE